MPKLSKFKKAIALTLLLIMVNNVLMPTMAWALTSGPARPESTSFEPIDTTDMVNMLSGDLAYNIPLLEIPGPEGGYPLSLSYHAGIMPEEEASWVGLGWTLNPGAIDRSVSGFPDDFNGQTRTARDYWGGGETSTTSVGVSIGLTGILSADIGITVGHDTFAGTGIGGYVGLSAGFELTKGVGASASLGFAVDPFSGDVSMRGSMGVGVSIAKSGNASLNAGVGIGFSTNFKSMNVGAGAGISASLSRGTDYKGNKAFSSASGSLLGASINSGGGGGISLSAGGATSSVENVNAGKLSTSSSSWGISIPVWFGVSISLSHNYQRYWSDETSSVPTYGTLYYPQSDCHLCREGVTSNLEFDTYYLADVNDASYDLFDKTKNDPIKSTGGTLPDYDTYSVLGQGISGSMRPYAYQIELIGKGKNEDIYETNPFSTNRSTTDYDSFAYLSSLSSRNKKNPTKLNFRFNNEFSNKYIQQNNDFISGVAQFDKAPIYGDNDLDYGFNTSTEHLASSRNIEYFTNEEILNNSAQQKGFINTQAKGFTRNINPDGTAIVNFIQNNSNLIIPTGDKRIGGFMVTNESGITYHYALPVYAYGEYSKTNRVGGVETFNEQTRSTPYATSWLLTAVTGPDYVDKNNNGQVDNADWGYWVNMEYGRWASDYKWATPYTGKNKDLDQNFEYKSSGLKELYYLDAIVTPTHTAIFNKEIRTDGKGVKDAKDNTQTQKYGGYPTAQLRLIDIILYNNKNLNLSLNQIRTASIIYNHVLPYKDSWFYTCCDYYAEWLSHPVKYKVVHTGENVIDQNDIWQSYGSSLNLNGNVLRRIYLNYDYSLSPQTQNSFDEGGNFYKNSNSQEDLNTVTKSGKLTLKSLIFTGKDAMASIPPTTFEYELPADKTINATVNYVSSATNTSFFNTSSPSFLEGDIIKCSQNNITYYGLIKNKINIASNSTTLEIKFIGAAPPTLSGSFSFTTTKNPPYSADNHDMWGMYKADFVANRNNENLSRIPSRASAKASDVWSLRKIHQPLGMTTDIVYEPDVYSRVALYKNSSITISSVQKYGTSSSSFKVNTTEGFGVDLRDFIAVDDNVKLSLATNYTTQVTSPQLPGQRLMYRALPDDGIGGTTTPKTYFQPLSHPALLVTEVGENYVIINDLSFYNKLFNVSTTIIGGNMSAGGLGNNYGGGLRIKQIVNREPISGVIMTAAYNYNIPGKPSLSSGTTSYEPLGIDVAKIRIGTNEVDFQKLESKDFSDLLGLVRTVPAPGVMYEYVGVTSSRTVDGQTVQALGSSQYQFEVFNKGMVSVTNKNPTKGTTETSNVSVRNYTSRVGSLKRMIQYDGENNKLSETINKYLYDEQTAESAEANDAQYETLLGRFNMQGLIMERTAEGRLNDGKTRRVMTANNTYPNIPTGSTTIDYKTGTVTNTQTLAYDMYSGQPIKTLTFDSYGNRFMNCVTPAYRVYPEMGLKFKDTPSTPRANMLTQVAEEYTARVDANNSVQGIISATATVWSKETNMLNDAENVVNTANAHTTALNIWRPFQTYQWKPQARTAGITPTNSFRPYFMGGSSGYPEWLLGSQITLYNKYSNPLEAFDVNGNFGATKMSWDQSKVLATASNARYDEMTYTGLEDGRRSTLLNISSVPMHRNIFKGNGNIISGVSHTGNNSLAFNPDEIGMYYNVNASQLKPGRNYMASVWVNSGPSTSATLYYTINNGTKTLATVNTTKRAGNWILVTLQIPSTAITPNSTLQVGCINNGNGSAFFDDFRFKPQNSSMTSYVYDNSTGELTYILDNNNLFTQFTYDTEGRLDETFVERLGYGVKKVAENKYNYSR